MKAQCWNISFDFGTIGWTNSETDPKLTVADIQIQSVIQVPSSAWWPEVALSRIIEPLDDFQIDFNISWDSYGDSGTNRNAAMQFLIIKLYDKIDIFTGVQSGYANGLVAGPVEISLYSKPKEGFLINNSTRKSRKGDKMDERNRISLIGAVTATTNLFVTTAFILINLLITFHSAPAWATWTDDSTVNKAISTAADDQKSPAVVSDGAGGAIITWEDRRGGSNYDIYAQRVDSNGNVLWTTDGVPIATGAGINENKPTIVSDGSGGAIIAWEVGSDIYAQRVDAGGIVQWTTNGVKISTTAVGANTDPEIASDGSGGAIITWETSHYDANYPAGSRYKYSIYARRVDANGNVLWIADVPISEGQQDNRYKLKPKIVSDGSGGAIITWYDNRVGAVGINVYAQRVDADGIVQWTINGQLISGANSDQLNPKIASDGSGGAIITWLDARIDYYDVYAQRVDADGNRLWLNPPNGGYEGIPISTASDYQEDPAIVSDGSGGAIITWYADYGVDYDIYAQKVDANGNVLWAVDGIPISTAADYQEHPKIVSDGSGGAIITWQNEGDEDYDVYAQRVGASGNMLWAVDGIPISTATDDQESPAIVSDGAGGAIISWPDRRGGSNYDIYTQRVYYNGTLVDSDGDGVPDGDDDNPADATIATPLTTTGTGKITVAASGGAFLTNVHTISDLAVNQAGKPTGYEFPDGLVSFRVNGVATGGTTTVILTFPNSAGSKYYTVDSNGFYEFTGAVVVGNTVTLTLTDNGSRDGGDSNGIANDGVIDEPGGVAVASSKKLGISGIYLLLLGDQ